MSGNSITQSDILPVIDAHAHIFPDAIAEKAKERVAEFYDLPMHTVGTLSELYRARKNGFQNRKIVMQVIFSPAMSAAQTKSINDFISDICLKDKSLIGFGTLHKDNEDYKSEIIRIKKLGLHGIKFHSDFQQTDIDDEQILPIYREAARNNLPVIFHMGDKRLGYSGVGKLKNVLREIPDLTVIASHMGGYMHWREAYDLLPADDRLYFDVSSTLSFISNYEFERMLEKFGIDRFFFGSDFPMWDPTEELCRLERFVHNDIDRRKIEYYNFIEFLHRQS